MATLVLRTEARNNASAIKAWQLKEIQKGITEANAGQLVEHSTIMKKWEKKREDLLD